MSFGWTAPSSGCFTIDTLNSTVTDTILAIFDDCDLTTGLACDDDFSPTNYRSSIDFTATAGTTYAIVVDGWGGSNNGSINLNINPCATPEVCGNGTIGGTETCDGTNVGTALCSDGTTPPTCSATCTLDFSACPSSDGELCSAPEDLTGATFPVALTGTFDNDPALPFGCGGGTATNVVWYEFTPPTTGSYTIDALNNTTTEAYSRLAIRTGLTCNPYGAEVACVTNSDIDASATVNLTAGTAYLIAFFTDGNAYAMVSSIVDITANVNNCGNGTIDTGETCDGTNIGTALCGDGTTLPTCTATCALDFSGCPTSGSDGLLCATPEDLTGATFPLSLTGTFDNDPAVGFSCDATATNVVWFEYTAPTTGNFTIDALNNTTTNAYSRLAVLNGTTCSPYGSEVACVTNSDLDASATVALTAGSTYLIAFFTDGPTYTMVDPIVDISPAGFCGDGTIGAGETCDGTNVGTALCSDGTTVPTCTATCALDFSGCPVPGGATCAAPEDVSGGPFPTSLTGTFDNDPAVGFSCDATATNVVWFEYTAPTTGSYTIDALNNTTDDAYSRIAVVTGTSCSPYGTEVACVTNSALDASATVNLTAGTTYLIAFFTDGNAYSMVDPILDITPPAPPATLTIDYCRLQHPPTITGNPGETRDTYGRLYIAGLTDQSPTNNTHPSLRAEFGFGPDGSMAGPSWTWAAATPTPGWDGNSDGEPNNDEYTHTWTLPAAGSYDYAYRFSGDSGVTWTYCDKGPGNEGSSNGYNPADAGQATVNGVVLPPETIVSWNFGPATNAGTLIATGGNPINAAKAISTTATGTLSYVSGFGGGGTASVSYTGWQSGVNTKAWVAEFNTTDYQDIVLTSSYHQSSNSGPRDFQLQYSLDGSNWVDIAGGALSINTGSTWFNLNGTMLPVAINNRSSVYLRWVVTSTTSANNGAIATTGTNRIDEIVIMGTPIP